MEVFLCNDVAVDITYSESALVALGIQHAIRKRHIFICDLRRSTIFFHIIPYLARFWRKTLLYIKHVF